EQDDQRASAQEHAQRSGGEQAGGDRQVPGNVRARHQSGGASVLADSLERREWLPRMTPPTAATSSTIDVISNASRWSVRKRRPIAAGLPKARVTCSWWESRPPAFRPITTMISTRSAPAASTAANCCQVGPPAQGASASPP